MIWNVEKHVRAPFLQLVKWNVRKVPTDVLLLLALQKVAVWHISGLDERGDGYCADWPSGLDLFQIRSHRYVLKYSSLTLSFNEVISGLCPPNIIDWFLYSNVIQMSYCAMMMSWTLVELPSFSIWCRNGRPRMAAHSISSIWMVRYVMSIMIVSTCFWVLQIHYFVTILDYDCLKIAEMRK